MINELYSLSVCIKNAEIQEESWHREYKLIPNITPQSPCVRIVLIKNHISVLESVSSELGKKIRKYGNNQGTFPAMNLAPLYRITGEEEKKELSRLLDEKGKGIDIQKIKNWCNEDNNNWSIQFLNKYKKCMQQIPKKLEQLLKDDAFYEPIFQLIQEVQLFVTPEIFYEELKQKSFELLERHENIVLALQILFHCGKKDKNIDNDYGSLSVIFDCEELEDKGISSASIAFTKGLNQSLCIAEKKKQKEVKVTGVDAFGIPFSPLGDPMPEVKMPGGFSASLRTMFKGQPCQKRYHLIGNDTFPIDFQTRTQLKDALTWISCEEEKDVTWINTDSNEILFAYPSKIPENTMSFTCPFGSSENLNLQTCFETETENFIKHLTQCKKLDPEHYPKNIQIFILRKLDRARTKVIYTRCLSTDEIIVQSDIWQQATRNLPHFQIGAFKILFPLQISVIMNRIWKHDGTLQSEKFKKFPNYHGIDLMFGVQKQVLNNDLHTIIDNSLYLSLYAGKMVNTITSTETKDLFITRLKDTLSVLGMLLYWLGIRKESYMKEYSYLLGQLLKVSDSLHELYCWVVRDKQIPSQLVGNSLYIAATEMPVSALAQLANRIMPYKAWATKNKDAQIIQIKTNKNGETEKILGPTAGYLLYLYEQIATQISCVLNPQVRFNDYEKAQLFIGYLAAFPKTEKNQSKNN